MKENEEDDKKELLLKKENDTIQHRKTFPVGYKDKREKNNRFYKKRKSRLSKNTSNSNSSESIEEKNEELEDDDNNKNINDKNENDVNKSNDFFTDNNLKQYALNDDDSDSEIVEEEIISEEILAQIYKNVDNNNQAIVPNNNIITPISETVIKKEVEDNKIEVDIKKNLEKKEKSEKVVKKSENLLFKYFNHKYLIGKLRKITLIVLVIYILLTITSIIIYAYKKEKKTIFCFEFVDYSNFYNNTKIETIEDKKYNPENSTDYNNNNDNKNNEKFFLSGLNSFILINTLLLFVFTSIISTLMKNEYLQLKHFFKGMSFYFPLTLILNMPIFIIGIIQDKYNDVNDPKIWTPIFFSVLTFLGMVLMSIVLISIKKHKYKSISSLININVLCSFLTAFECYSFIYCICFLLRSIFIKNEYISLDYMSIPEIIAGIVYFAIGFFITITLKNIYFSFIVVIVEIGLLYVKKKYSMAVVFLNVITTFFTFSSIIFTIFKYKKKVFGLAHVD